MPIAIDEGFEGSPATWFYLDRTAGTLSQTVPSATFATTANVAVSIVPRFFNAPRQAQGTNPRTQFLGQAKPAAYLKAQLDQDVAGTSTKPLTYAAMYSIVNATNDDISSTFFDEANGDDPLQDVPLPGGSGQFRTPITAIVGGEKPKSSLVDIITQVIGLASTPAATALFPIPAADLALAATIESLINNATTAFAPETKQQYWIDNAPIAIAANAVSASAADSDTLQFAAGATLFAIFPLGEGGAIESAINALVAQRDLKFAIDHGGSLTAARNGVLVDPNPFANFLYVTYRATVTAAP